MTTRSADTLTPIPSPIAAYFTRAATDSRTAIKLISICLFFLPQFGFLWYRPNVSADPWGGSAPSLWVLESLKTLVAHSQYGYALIYAAACTMCVAGVVVAPFFTSTALRVTVAVVFGLAWGADVTILDINGSFSTQSILTTLWAERAQAGTFEFYKAEFVRNLFFTVLVCACWCVPPRAIRLSARWLVVPLSACIVVGAIIVKTRAAKEAFPGPFPVLVNTALITMTRGAADVHPLVADLTSNRNFAFTPAVSPSIDHIVVVMDESVHGDYLSINNPALSTTPFLKEDPDLINFGVAVSGANCSTFSRLMLRFGMRHADLANWSDALKRPTMWEYAKAAGFATVFIDTFAGPLQYASGFSPIEQRQVDEKRSVLDSPTYVRDDRLVDAIAETTARARGKKLFLYVDKFGIHVPYSDRYPDDQARFVAPHQSGRDALLQQYKDAVSWSVDRFFARLRGKLDLDHTLLIYTSDHGQSLSDGAYKQSHCSENGDVVAGEGKIPLLAMSRVPWLQARLRQRASGAAHFAQGDIFPTLLVAMGYPEDDVRKDYSTSLLFGTHSAPLGFFVGSPTHPRFVVVGDGALSVRGPGK